jgi:hypothetical protein
MATTGVPFTTDDGIAVNSRRVPLVIVAAAIAVAIAVSIGSTSSPGSASSPNPRDPDRVAKVGLAADGDQPWFVKMYWILGSGLLPTRQTFYGPIDADPVITAMEDGPSQSLFVPGLGTAIAPGRVVRSATTAGDRVVVNLDPAYQSGMGGQQVLGLAQLALTLTSIPGIHSVEFEVDGRNVAVPTAGQAAVTRPVDKADYSELLTR